MARNRLEGDQVTASHGLEPDLGGLAHVARRPDCGDRRDQGDGQEASQSNREPTNLYCPIFSRTVALWHLRRLCRVYALQSNTTELVLSAWNQGIDGTTKYGIATGYVSAVLGAMEK